MTLPGEGIDQDKHQSILPPDVEVLFRYLFSISSWRYLEDASLGVR